MATALTTAAEMQKISSALGEADAQLQAQLDATVYSTTTYSSNKPAGNLAYVRSEIKAAPNSDPVEFDLANALQTAVRAVEKSIPGIITPGLATIPPAFQTYIAAETGLSFRTYFKSSMVSGGNYWTDNFRTFWRRVQKEELVVRVAYIARASGSWTLTNPDHAISLDTALEVRTGTGAAIGAAAIDITLTLTHASGAANETFTYTVPANTPAGTVIPISIAGSTNKFSGIATWTIGANPGTNGDQLELWVS